MLSFLTLNYIEHKITTICEVEIIFIFASGTKNIEVFRKVFIKINTPLKEVFLKPLVMYPKPDTIV